MVIDIFRQSAVLGVLALSALGLSNLANAQGVRPIGNSDQFAEDFFDQVLLEVSAESLYMSSMQQPGCAPYAGCTDTMRARTPSMPPVPQTTPPSTTAPPMAQPFAPPTAPIALAGLQSRAPIIGDFFGIPSGGFMTIQPSPFFGQNEQLVIPDPIILPIISVGGAPGANVGKLKLAENTSPIPTDRVFVNYSYFDNTPLAIQGVNVNRVTPGFEKTFCDGNMSFELRAPFASTLDSTQTLGMINTNEVEFGNLTMYLKALLWSKGTSGVSAGLGTAVPTASDVELFSGNTQILNIENEGVHLLPFIGGYYLPQADSRFFMQGILQFDVDVNGNAAYFSTFEEQEFFGPATPTGDLQFIGRGRDALYMFLDINLGYWIYQARDRSSWIQGIAPMFELHYNRTLDDADVITSTMSDGTSLSTQVTDLDLTNAVIGLTTLIGDDATLTVGYGTPLHGHDQQFDGELRILFNWYFGGRGANRFLPPSY